MVAAFDFDPEPTFDFDFFHQLWGGREGAPTAHQFLFAVPASTVLFDEQHDGHHGESYRTTDETDTAAEPEMMPGISVFPEPRSLIAHQYAADKGDHAR